MTGTATLCQRLTNFYFLSNANLNRVRRQVRQDHEFITAAMDDDVISGRVSGWAFAFDPIGVVIDDGNDSPVRWRDYRRAQTAGWLAALVQFYKIVGKFLAVDFTVMVGFGWAGRPGDNIPVAGDRRLKFEVLGSGLAHDLGLGIHRAGEEAESADQ